MRIVMRRPSACVMAGGVLAWRVLLTPAAWPWWPAVRVGNVGPGDPEVFPDDAGTIQRRGPELLAREAELRIPDALTWAEFEQEKARVLNS